MFNSLFCISTHMSAVCVRLCLYLQLACLSVVESCGWICGKQSN